MGFDRRLRCCLYHHTLCHRGCTRWQRLGCLFHFNQAHSGSVNLDYRVSGTNTQLDGIGSNLLFTFNSGHAFTYVYRPVGGQVSAFDAGVDYMNDTRSRQALEPIGSSTTPWVYNLDLKLDKRFDIGGYGLTVFARVNNLLDRRNALNVYQASGSATDDGFYGNDVYSASFIELYGQDPDGDGVVSIEEFMKVISHVIPCISERQAAAMMRSTIANSRQGQINIHQLLDSFVVRFQSDNAKPVRFVLRVQAVCGAGARAVHCTRLPQVHTSPICRGHPHRQRLTGLQNMTR